MAKQKRVRPGEAFAFRNGQTAETIDELIARLKTIDPADFNYHVNDQKNDIYTWLRDCLDPRLAEKVKDVRELDKLIEVLR